MAGEVSQAGMGNFGTKNAGKSGQKEPSRRVKAKLDQFEHRVFGSAKNDH